MTDTERELLEIAKTARDYASDMAMGYGCTIEETDDGGLTIKRHVEMGRKDLARIDAVIAKAEAAPPSDVPGLVSALDGLQQFFALPDECSVGRFDRLAEQYRRETGNWAPGKSIPDAYNDSTDCDTRRAQYDAWVQSKVYAARAAIAKATGADT